MTYCVYLTHPEVQIDPAVPVPDWGLSEIGKQRAQNTCHQTWAADIQHVFSSAENKAIETAQIFSRPFGLKVQVNSALHENDRSSTGFLPPSEFEQVADQFFAHPTTSVRGWETAAAAQKRVVDCISGILLTLPEKDPVLFSGHGGVGTLLKCHLLGVPISRTFDQTDGGHFYLFEKSLLQTQSAQTLEWQRL